MVAFSAFPAVLASWWAPSVLVKICAFATSPLPVFYYSFYYFIHFFMVVFCHGLQLISKYSAAIHVSTAFFIVRSSIRSNLSHTFSFRSPHTILSRRSWSRRVENSQSLTNVLTAVRKSANDSPCFLITTVEQIPLHSNILLWLTIFLELIQNAL